VIVTISVAGGLLDRFLVPGSPNPKRQVKDCEEEYGEGFQFEDVEPARVGEIVEDGGDDGFVEEEAVVDAGLVIERQAEPELVGFLRLILFRRPVVVWQTADDFAVLAAHQHFAAFLRAEKSGSALESCKRGRGPGGGPGDGKI
jgi:hypothetical protein